MSTILLLVLISISHFFLKDPRNYTKIIKNKKFTIKGDECSLFWVPVLCLTTFIPWIIRSQLLVIFQVTKLVYFMFPIDCDKKIRHENTFLFHITVFFSELLVSKSIFYTVSILIFKNKKIISLIYLSFLSNNFCTSF